jgi:hypothetical protein
MDMINLPRIERRGPPHHPVDFVALREQQFGQIRPILVRLIVEADAALER